MSHRSRFYFFLPKNGMPNPPRPPKPMPPSPRPPPNGIPSPKPPRPPNGMPRPKPPNPRPNWAFACGMTETEASRHMKSFKEGKKQGRNYYRPLLRLYSVSVTLLTTLIHSIIDQFSSIISISHLLRVFFC